MALAPRLCPSPRRTCALLAAALAGALAGAGLPADPVAAPEDGPETLVVSGFAIAEEIVVPGTPRRVFDAFTGDVSGWWDHHFSEDPVALVIEPRPGGHFYETFDEEGDGAIHATVTHLRRSDERVEMVFRGPLGFGFLGVHFDMVHRFVFTAEEAEDGAPATRLRMTAHGVGEVQDGWAETVGAVWHHFLHERFGPYVRDGR